MRRCAHFCLAGEMQLIMRGMAHRFFLSPHLLASDEIALPEETARQVHTVLRLRPGEHILVLDGLGAEVELELTSVSRTRVIGRVLERRAGIQEPRASVTLCQGLLKADLFEWVLQKGTELGVASFLPMQSRRSLPGLEAGGEHLSRTAMASWAAPTARDDSTKIEDQAEDDTLSSASTGTPSPSRWQLAEALLLISGRLSAAQLAAGLHCGLFEVEETIQELQHQLAGHGILIQEMNGEYQFASLDTLAPALRSSLSAIGLAPRKQTQLTQAQREVLALVIMHQPITRSAIERYRGVDCEKPLHALIEAELVEPLPATTPTGARQYISTLMVLEESGYTSLEALHQAISKGVEALTLGNSSGLS